jgi:hypothetical protein
MYKSPAHLSGSFRQRGNHVKRFTSPYLQNPFLLNLYLVLGSNPAAPPPPTLGAILDQFHDLVCARRELFKKSGSIS